MQGFIPISQLRQHFTPCLHSLLSLTHVMQSSKPHSPIQLVTLASSTLPSSSPPSLVPNSRDWETPVSHLSPSLCSTAHLAGPGWASRTSALGSCRHHPNSPPSNFSTQSSPGPFVSSRLIPQRLAKCPFCRVLTQFLEYPISMQACYCVTRLNVSQPPFLDFPPNNKNLLYFSHSFAVCLFWKVWRWRFYHRMISVFFASRSSIWKCPRCATVKSRLILISLPLQHLPFFSLCDCSFWKQSPSHVICICETVCLEVIRLPGRSTSLEMSQEMYNRKSFREKRDFLFDLKLMISGNGLENM